MDGNTNIPHKILEKLAICEFSATDFRIIFVILRKTYGWHKDSDRISYTQFEQLTKTSRFTVWNSLSRLIKSQVVIATKNGSVEYRINPDVDSWVVSKSILVSKSKRGSQQKLTRVVSKSLLVENSENGSSIPKKVEQDIVSGGVVSKSILVSKSKPTKDTKITNTKDTNTKDSDFTFEEFLEDFNSIRQHFVPNARGITVVEKKAKQQFAYLLKQGIKREDMQQALKSLFFDPFHKSKNWKYCTPEFITRSDKFARFSMTEDSQIPEQGMVGII